MLRQWEWLRCCKPTLSTESEKEKQSPVTSMGGPGLCKEEANWMSGVKASIPKVGWRPHTGGFQLIPGLICRVQIFWILALWANSIPVVPSDTCLRSLEGSSHTKEIAFHGSLPQILFLVHFGRLSRQLQPVHLPHLSGRLSLCLSSVYPPFSFRPSLTQFLPQLWRLVTIINPTFHSTCSSSPSWSNPD